jgi:CRISPR/Cas system-associated exonuclease Cas4 (RecB family)
VNPQETWPIPGADHPQRHRPDLVTSSRAAVRLTAHGPEAAELGQRPEQHASYQDKDDSRLGARTLRSERLGLVARPDHLVQLGDGAVIPVEQKPRARQLYQSHVLELGAQLALVEANVGRRPPYGVIVLASGIQRRIAFDRSLEDAVFRAVGQMRAHIESDSAPGRRWLGAKCRACEFYECCWPS